MAVNFDKEKNFFMGGIGAFAMLAVSLLIVLKLLEVFGLAKIFLWN